MSSSPQLSAPPARLEPAWRVSARLEAPFAPEKTQRPANDHAAQDVQPASSLLSSELLIEVDAAAGRFVHFLRDAETKEVLRQFPSEAQLAYSRGVAAYVSALRAKP